MASGEPPIIVKPGISDDEMGICVEFDDTDQQWSITEDATTQTTTITYPHSAVWHVERRPDGAKSKVVIYITGKEGERVRLTNVVGNPEIVFPINPDSICEVHFRDIPAPNPATQGAPGDNPGAVTSEEPKTTSN